MRLFQANLLVEDVEWGSDSRRNRPPWAEPHPFKRRTEEALRDSIVEAVRMG
jgi:hypothetical protein